jgi:hypothetical protein
MLKLELLLRHWLSAEADADARVHAVMALSSKLKRLLER